jgi:hypothetical protein
VPGFLQPTIQARHLAFAEARHIGAAPGVAAVDHLALGGDQHATPRRAAIGAVTKRLVAVMITSLSPASRCCPAVQALGSMIGSMQSRM